MKELIIYVHGKGGNADEAEHYKQLFTASDVIGFDYHSQNPWDAKEEFSKFVDSYSAKYDSVILVANSIGAFFCLSSLSDKQIDKAFLISPIVNMEKLICDMMLWANVNESELAEEKEIKTETANYYGVWRDVKLGLFMLCTRKSDRMECSNVYVIW